MPDATALTPDPRREDWIDFLHYLAADWGCSALEIVRCVEKPHSFGPEYAEYRAEGGLGR